MVDLEELESLVKSEKVEYEDFIGHVSIDSNSVAGDVMSAGTELKETYVFTIPEAESLIISI